MVDLLTGSKPCIDCPPRESELKKSMFGHGGRYKYGWFSKMAKDNFGSMLYRSYDDPSIEIEITAVISAEHGNDKEYPSYGWTDKVYVGKVTDCLYKKLYS